MKALLPLAILCILAISSFAQDAGRGPTVHVGAGYTPLVGPLSKRLDNGWNIQVGGGWMFSRYFGLVGDYQYKGLGVPQSVLIIGGIGWYRRTVEFTSPTPRWLLRTWGSK